MDGAMACWFLVVMDGTVRLAGRVAERGFLGFS
ncbi:hypothetical protein SFR_4706 [Streptomyces sp. FR-008]|nr:hypothetical protein SFR_4706 [Streptomyces sp. FR-008]